MAAGAGRRMRPLSNVIHKAMLPIGGTTILAAIVEGLQGIGASTVTVVTGYRASEIEAYLSTSCTGPTYRFVHNPDFATTNNIVSLLLGLQRADPGQDVVLIECDLLLGPGLLERLVGPERGNIALVDRYRTGMDGTVVRVRDGVLVQVLPPEAQGDGFEYRDTYKTLNVYRFSAAFCADVLVPLLARHIAEVDVTSYYEAVLARLGDLTEHRIAAAVVDGEPWAEVDDPHDLAAARFRFEPSERGAIVDRRRGGQWDLELVDFAFMRNAYFPPEAMLAAMRHALADLVDGYGSAQPVLDEKLAWHLRCAPERVVALNGAAQAFPILRRLWAQRSVAYPAPTFGEYPRMFPRARTYADAPGIAPDALERLAGEVDVLVAVNPNNPTGTTVRTAALHALAARHPQTTILVDESFIDFSDEPSLVSLLEAHPLPNVVVLCSLSKTLGAPGLRIGYVYTSDAALHAAVCGELPIWNMGAPAEYFVELLLKFRPQLAASLVQTKHDREVFQAALEASSWVATAHASGGNFLLVELLGDAEVAPRLRQALLVQEGIDVKDVTDKFGDGRPRLRLAVRRPEENHALVTTIQRLISWPSEISR